MLTGVYNFKLSAWKMTPSIFMSVLFHCSLLQSWWSRKLWCKVASGNCWDASTEKLTAEAIALCQNCKVWQKAIAFNQVLQICSKTRNWIFFSTNPKFWLKVSVCCVLLKTKNDNRICFLRKLLGFWQKRFCQFFFRKKGRCVSYKGHANYEIYIKKKWGADIFWGVG